MSEISLPIIMLHKYMNHLIWLCSLNDEERIESVILNTKTNEKMITFHKDIEKILEIKKEMENNGWIKGYIPDINLLLDGKIVNEIKV